MNNLVRQLANDDGEPIEDPKWHLLVTLTGDNALLCTGEFTDDGCHSGNGALYEFKSTKRGGITCEWCLKTIKELKAVKL